jgi:hypothetical protein
MSFAVEKSTRYFVLAAGLLSGIPGFAGEVSGLVPESAVDHNYRQTYVYYHRIFSPEKKQVRYFYMNRLMAQSLRTGTPIPVGAIIVLEVYGAKVDSGGRVVVDAAGNLVPGPLNVISVMETIANANKYAFGKSPNGDWMYYFFSPDFEDKSTSRDRAACMDCHGEAAQSNFVFTFEPMLKAVR